MATFKTKVHDQLHIVTCPFSSLHRMKRKKLEPHLRRCPNHPTLGTVPPDNPNIMVCPFTEHHWFDPKHLKRHLDYDCQYARRALSDVINMKKTDPTASIKANKENIPPPSTSHWTGDSDSDDDGKMPGQKRKSMTTSEILKYKKTSYEQYCKQGPSALPSSDNSYSWFYGSNNTGTRDSEISTGSDTVFASDKSSIESDNTPANSVKSTSSDSSGSSTACSTDKDSRSSETSSDDKTPINSVSVIKETS